MIKQTKLFQILRLLFAGAFPMQSTVFAILPFTMDLYGRKAMKLNSKSVVALLNPSKHYPDEINY